MLACSDNDVCGEIIYVRQKSLLESDYSSVIEMNEAISNVKTVARGTSQHKPQSATYSFLEKN